MNIWIINYHTGIPGKASNPRYIEFAKHFREQGWNVTTFNALQMENGIYKKLKEEEKFYYKNYDGYDFVHVKVPSYKGNSFKRGISLFNFAKNIHKNRNKFNKPDIILHNVHIPFDYPLINTAKKLGAKYIAESWDVWPDNFVKSGLISSKNPVMKFFYYIEKKIYEKADQVIFTFSGMYDYLRDKKWSKDRGGKIDLAKIHYNNNGVNIKEFNENIKKYPRMDEDLNNSSIKKIIYAGSMNMSNSIMLLIETAKLFKNDSSLIFLLYGNGKDRNKIEDIIKKEKLDNVILKEKHVPLHELAWILSQSYLNLMIYKKDFAYRGISSGKLFQYLAAGKPIVCNIHIYYDDIITNNKLGIAKDMHTPEELANGINQIIRLSPKEYEQTCNRVLTVAEEFDYKKLAEKEISIIKQTLNIK